MGLIATLTGMNKVFPKDLTNEWIKQMPRRQLSEAEKKVSYAKYYDKEMTAIPVKDLACVNLGEVDEKKALSIWGWSQLLEEGHLEIETGHCLMADGTGFAATNVFMPNVTPKMLDWWFNWHPLESLRYTIWCPVAHVGISAKEPLAHKDCSKTPLHTRNFDKVHYPVEGFDIKGAEKIKIQFHDPIKLGLEPALMPKEAEGSLFVATVSKQIGFVAVPISMFVHYARRVEGGTEYRSRYWPGWTTNHRGEIIRSKIKYPRNFIRGMARNNCIHSLIEYNHLASILPDLYKEQNGEII